MLQQSSKALSQQVPDGALGVTLSPSGAEVFRIVAETKQSKTLIGKTTVITLPHGVWVTKGRVADDQRSAVFIVHEIDVDGGIRCQEILAVHLDSLQRWQIDHRMTAEQLSRIDQRTRFIHDIKSIENLPVVILEVGTTPPGGIGNVTYQAEHWNIDIGKPAKVSPRANQ